MWVGGTQTQLPRLILYSCHEWQHTTSSEHVRQADLSLWGCTTSTHWSETNHRLTSLLQHELVHWQYVPCYYHLQHIFTVCTLLSTSETCIEHTDSMYTAIIICNIYNTLKGKGAGFSSSTSGFKSHCHPYKSLVTSARSSSQNFSHALENFTQVSEPL